MNFTIYRAKKTNDGAATRLEKTDNGVFLVSAKQSGTDSNGNATFAWSGKKDKEGNLLKSEEVTMKLGLPDIGEILSVLKGKKTAVGGKNGLFHQNAEGSTSLTFSLLSKKDDKGVLSEYYTIRIASKKGDKLTAVSHTISIGEGCVIETLLNKTVLELTKTEKFNKKT